ncbi:hypothetical protein SRO_7117 [Streptomyces rochei]|nr:hypothetical protein SRO_7117 [Streptomyces rochei]
MGLVGVAAVGRDPGRAFARDPAVRGVVEADQLLGALGRQPELRTGHRRCAASRVRGGVRLQQLHRDLPRGADPAERVRSGAAVGGSTSLAVLGAYGLAGEPARADGDREWGFPAYEWRWRNTYGPARRSP